MLQIKEQSHEEKYLMYDKLDKSILIEMLIEANNQLEQMKPIVGGYCQCTIKATITSDNVNYFCRNCGHRVIMPKELNLTSRLPTFNGTANLSGTFSTSPPNTSPPNGEIKIGKTEK